MSRAPKKETDDGPVARVKNYITPSGLQRLKDEHKFLLTRERPAVTQVVAWAASNGDRSENADYQYGKRRLRQIDRADSLSHEANRCRGSGRPGNPSACKGSDAGLLRGDRALRQCRGNGARGECRRHRRGRSRPQPHQLGVATGARADEVAGQATAWFFTRRAARSSCSFWKCVTSAFPWNRSANHLAPRPRRSTVLASTVSYAEGHACHRRWLAVRARSDLSQ